MASNYTPDKAYIRIDIHGNLDKAGEYVLFGQYPTSRITDDELISTLNSLSGKLPTNGSNEAWTSYKYYIFDDNDKDFMWYIDIVHENQIYRGVYFTEYRPNDTMNFPDENYQEGNGYTVGNVYWFKYDPIKWKILEDRGDKAWIITDTAIDSQPYRNIVWDNSYVSSSIRQWLNNDFIETAFDENEKVVIAPACITNPIEAQEDPETGEVKYGGGDTIDFVHLLSDDEASDMMLHGSRQAKATDYAISQGIRLHHKTGNPEWWLRSPYESVMAWAQTISGWDYCDFCESDITGTGVGIRPALWLKL